MDFFKLLYDVYPTVLDQGGIFINNISRAMWVERYSTPGEFSFESPLSTGLKDFLPLGTLVSHIDTSDLMIVENHDISEQEDEDPVIKITGRSLPSYLENRMVGMNAARVAPSLNPYLLSADWTFSQIQKLINDHIQTPYDTNDALNNVRAMHLFFTGYGTNEARNIDYGNVWQKVEELLKVDDLGISVQRRPSIFSTTETLLYINKGGDRRDTVSFNWQGGDISGAEYLFSLKDLKTSALVKSKYFVVPVDLAGSVGYNRRMIEVDASDIDEHFTAIPTGTDFTNVIAAMNVRGRQVLKKQTTVSIVQSDISKIPKFQYRKDYFIGDLVTLNANFGQIVTMRVVEYAEIEDENGESGHPTLAVPGS
jgi:hypothetical protein